MRADRAKQVGILLAIVQQLGFTVETSAIHAYGGGLSPPQMSLLRCLGGVGIALTWAALVGWRSLWTHHPKLQAARGIITASYGFFLMWGFATIPLLDATAISYLTAIWTVAGAPLIGEHWTPQRITAVVLGFGGALLVIRPTFSGASFAYVLFALAGALNGANYLLNRYLQDGDQADSSIAILFYANGLAAAMTAGPAFTAPWGHFSPVLVVGIVLVGPLAMLVGIIAARFIEASTMAPFNYVRLVLVLIVSLLWLKEPLSLLSLAGGAIIIGACYLAARKPRVA